MVVVSGNNGKAVRAFAAVTGVNGGARGTVYVFGNGRQETWWGGSPAWRNRNPGNLRPSPDHMAHHVGQIGEAGGFAVFASAAEGLAAMTALLQRPLYQSKTLAQVIATYAPPEDRNPTAAYLAYVCSASGLAEDVAMTGISGEQLAMVTEAMCRFEGCVVGKVERAAMAA